MKTRKITIAVLLMILLIAPAVALAQGGGDSGKQVASATTDESDKRLESRKEQIEEKRRALEEKLSQRSARKCELIKVRLESQRDKAAEIRVHRKARYQHIVDRLNAVADRLDGQEIDSTELRSAISELTDLIATFDVSFAEYETSLQTVINDICSDERPADRQSLKQARQLLVKLRSNAESIHTFFQDELKPILADIKSMISAERDSAETESDQ